MYNSERSYLYIFLLCLLTASPICIGQDSLDFQRDSLLALIDQTSLGESIVDIYNEISTLDKKDTVQQKKYIDIAYNLAVKNDYLGGQLESIIYLSRLYYTQKRYAKTNEELDKGINLIKQHASSDGNDFRLKHSKLLEFKGFVKIQYKEFYESIDYFNQALNLLDESEFDKKASILLTIAYVFTEVGDYALSIEILNEAKPYFIKSNNYFNLIVCYNNTGENYLKRKEYEKALIEYESALTLSKGQKIYALMGALLKSKGYCQMELGFVDEARANFEKALSIYEKENNTNYAAYCRLFIAKLNFIKTKDKTLLSEYDDALEIGRQNQDLQLQQFSTSAMAEALTMLGQYEKANVHYVNANQLQDSITDKELLLQLRSLNEKHRFETDKRRMEIEKSKEVLSNKLAYQNKVILLLMGLVLIVLLSGLLIYRAYKKTSRAKQKLMVNNIALQKTEAHLSESNKEMQKYIDLNVELEQFAYIASHDIKAPLRTIQSFASILKEKFYDVAEDKHRVYFDFIMKGTSSLNILIDDLLEYSKSNTKKLNIHQFNFKNLLEEIIQLLDFSLTQVNGEIEMINCDFMIHADQIKMKQILQNLLSNALKFIDENRAPRVVVEAKQEKEHVIISVKDNGIGVEEEYFDEIFEKFSRLNSKSKYEGTGLGLAICSKYVKEHNGEISISRNHDFGVTITFSISKFLDPSPT